MNMYDTAWKQIVQPPKSNYDSSVEFPAEIRANDQIYGKHEVEYTISNLKESVK